MFCGLSYMQPRPIQYDKKANTKVSSMQYQALESYCVIFIKCVRILYFHNLIREIRTFFLAVNLCRPESSRRFQIYE